MSNRWKIACLDVWEQDVQDATRAVAPDDFDLHFATSYDDAEQLGLAADSDFILAGWSPVPAAMIEGSPKVRMVHKWGIGFDKIDLEACRKAGIPVLITAGANKGPVAEHTIMLMLAVYRQLGRMDQGIRGGRWLKKEARSATRRLDGKTVGLLGFGNIGRMVAQKIRGFDVDLTYYDIQRADRETEKELGIRFVSYDDLLSSSDVLSLHVPLDDGNWPIYGPSPIPWDSPNQVPIEMTRADMDRIKADFVAATERALLAGFDMVELHCAHGYLLSSFITPLSNHRTDAYGGSLENRIRYPLEVFEAMRAVWPSDKPMAVRLSATDWVVGQGMDGDQSVRVAAAFREAGADLIDVSAGQTTPKARPVYGRMFQTPFSDQIRNAVGCATMAVGNIYEPDHVNSILAAGRADLVALARPHLLDPNWTLRAAAELAYRGADVPRQYAAGFDQLARNLERAQQMEFRA